MKNKTYMLYYLGETSVKLLAKKSSYKILSVCNSVSWHQICNAPKIKGSIY